MWVRMESRRALGPLAHGTYSLAAFNLTVLGSPLTSEAWRLHLCMGKNDSPPSLPPTSPVMERLRGSDVFINTKAFSKKLSTKEF